MPPDHPRSNYGAAARDLALADGKHGAAFRMEGERDLADAAAAYETLLRGRFGVARGGLSTPMTLGIGDDGHTASLFPGIGAVAIDDRLVAHIPEQPAKKLEARVTLTAPVILEARLAVMLARGASKKNVVDAAVEPGERGGGAVAAPPAGEGPGGLGAGSRGGGLGTLAPPRRRDTLQAAKLLFTPEAIMRASRLVALSVFSLALFSTAAWADETAKPALKNKVTVVSGITIQGPHHVAVSVDVARLVPRAPLPDLRQPLVDRIAAAADNDPF